MANKSKLNNIFYNKKIRRILLLVIFLLFVVVIIKPTKEKEVKLNNNKIDKTQFQMYKSKPSGEGDGYELYRGNSFPVGYTLNLYRTTCVDNKGNKIDNAYTYNNGKITVTSNKTIYCMLYFDQTGSLNTTLASTNPLVTEYKGTGWVDGDVSEKFFNNHIYYWYAADSTDANTIKDSWNVVYAGHCWQMIRTTENGGVKLLYNGEPEEVVISGETKYNCGDDRNLYHMGGIESEYSISGSKVYADSYTATTSGTTTTFTLVNSNGSTPTSTSINSSNASSAVGKYTCGNTSTTCTNEGLMKIVSIKTGTTAIVYKSTFRDIIGKSEFNSSSASPAYVGYMYNDHTESILKSFMDSLNWGGTSTYSQSTRLSISTSTRFSATAPVWNGTTNKYDALASTQTATQIKGSDSDYSGLVGWYTYGNTSATYTSDLAYYVVAVSGNYMYVRAARNGALPSNANTTTYTIGTSITDNMDGTYTIDSNSVNTYDITTWSSSILSPSPSSSNYYFMCADGVSTTCTYGEMRSITSVSSTSFYVWYLPNTFNTYGTYKTSTTLVNNNNDTYTLSGTTNDILAIKLNRLYSSMSSKFVCHGGNTICAKDNVFYTYSFPYSGPAYIISPAINYKLSNSYSYSNGTYTLDMNDSNAINTWYDFYAANNNNPQFTDSAYNSKMAKAHYVCLDANDNLDPDTTSCSNVGYIYYRNAINVYFMKLSGGQYINTDIDNALYQEDNNLLWKMLYTSNVNTTDSIIKSKVDKWYEANILNTSVESKIDNDEIYCGDRSTSNNFGGLNLNASNIGTMMKFYGLGYKSVSINNSNVYVYNLSCPNKLDAYSKNETAKGNGALTYAIGLISWPELRNLFNSNNAHGKSTTTYWTETPDEIYISAAYARDMRSDADLTYATGGNVTNNYGVRPSIALTSSVQYTRGNGSMTNPYVVE